VSLLRVIRRSSMGHLSERIERLPAAFLSLPPLPSPPLPPPASAVDGASPTSTQSKHTASKQSFAAQRTLVATREEWLGRTGCPLLAAKLEIAPRAAKKPLAAAMLPCCHKGQKSGTTRRCVLQRSGPSLLCPPGPGQPVLPCCWHSSGSLYACACCSALLCSPPCTAEDEMAQAAGSGSPLASPAAAGTSRANEVYGHEESEWT
jgi:hypothetical protein